MTRKDIRPEQVVELRRQAEEIARENAASSPEILAALSLEEIGRILHELRVHQVELEMQNEHLRETQAGLDAARVRYLDLYDFAPVGYCTLSEKGLILEANLTAATLLGVVRSELIKQPITWFILKEDQDVYFLHRKQLFETGEPQVCDLRMVKQDGTSFWAHMEATAVQDADSVTVCRVIISDISKRKRIEASLLESEKRFSTLAALAPAGIYQCNPQGHCQYVNSRWCEMAGLSLEEALGDGWIKGVHPEDRDSVFSNWQQIVTSEGRWGFEYRFLAPAGKVTWVYGLAAPLHDTLGNIVAYVGINTDITDRKQAEAEKAKLEAQNRQLQKAESLGRMAGAIAHHFNNQLQAVMGNLEMAMDDLPQGSATSESLTEALQAAHNAAEISGQMLSYLGQTPSCRHEPLDLSEICRQSLALLQAVAPKGMIIVPDFPSSGPVIRANAGQLQQVLTNLLTNAWEAASGKKGSVALTVKTVSQADIPASKRFPIDWQPLEKGYACLAVSDAGCGISCKDIEKIFDPFYSTKFTGRGMGLSVVLGIVKAHNGGITVESEPSRGSVFRVYFPVSTDEAPLQPDKQIQSLEIKEGGTLLLIEDEEQVRNMSKKMLTRLGYTVLEAKDGAEAVEIFQQHQDEIRCVLSDLTMPRMNGWDTLAALRKLSPDIPVILSSGYDEAQVMAEEHQERPNAFLGKPYRLQDIKDTIRHTLADKKKSITRI